MDSRTNTIAGWVLFAGIVALGSSILAGEYFNHERPEKMGYPIEGVSDAVEEGAAAEQPVAFYLATADPKLGEQVFKKCMACHTIAKGGLNGNGPNLWGVLGGPVGHSPSFAYTADLKALGGTWEWEKMNHWVKAPKEVVPKTKMGFPGLGKPEDRANLLAYINTQSDRPIPLPPPPAAAPAPAATAAGKGEKEPVLNEAQAMRSPGRGVAGEGAPAVSGNAQQTKTGH